MESLKIAIASDWFYPKVGGIEAHIDELARRLLSAGHEPYVITHDYRYLRPYSDDFPYPVVRFPASVYLKKYHVSFGSSQFWRINEFYKEVNFDITHVHSIYSPLSVAVSKISRGIRGVPVVATNHSFYGKPPLDPVIRPLVRHELKKVDTFIAVSTPVAEDTRRLLGDSIEGRPVFVVPNGIEVSRWRPPEPEEREKAREELGIKDELAILYVGRMTERKNAHKMPFILREALKLGGIPKDRVKLLVVGDGPMRPVLEENLLKTGIGEITVMKNFVPRGELLHLYWASDLVVVPGLLETFSVVALEAMATGRPVVGHNGSGLSDVVSHGKTGLLSLNEKDMARNLALLLTDRELLVKMGFRARKRVERRFSWENVLKRLLRVYRVTLDVGSEVDRRYLFYKIMRRIDG